MVGRRKHAAWRKGTQHRAGGEPPPPQSPPDIARGAQGGAPRRSSIGRAGKLLRAEVRADARGAEDATREGMSEPLTSLSFHFILAASRMRSSLAFEVRTPVQGP